MPEGGRLGRASLLGTGHAGGIALHMEVVLLPSVRRRSMCPEAVSSLRRKSQPLGLTGTRKERPGAVCEVRWALPSPLPASPAGSGLALCRSFSIVTPALTGACANWKVN